MGLKKWINERRRRGKNEALTETGTSLIGKDRYSDCGMHDRIRVKSDLRTWSIPLVAVPAAQIGAPTNDVSTSSTPYITNSSRYHLIRDTLIQGSDLLLGRFEDNFGEATLTMPRRNCEVAQTSEFR